MSFKVPFDSSPPSTPGKSRSLFSLSETPAGAPPSASNSFTPQGAPPSTVFGSSQMSSRSQFDSPGSLFTKSGNINPNDSIFGSSIASFDYPAPRGRKAAPAKSFAPSQSLFSVTNDSRFGDSTNFGPSDSLTSSQMEEGVEGEEAVPEEEEVDGDMDVGDTTRDGNRLSFLDSQFGKPVFPQSTSQDQRKPIYTNPSNAKRPKLDEKWANQSPLRKTKLSPKKDSPIPSIVRNFTSRSRIASVEEPSQVIINTEDEICRLYDEVRKAEYQDVDFQVTLSEVCSQLTEDWELYAEYEGVSRISSTQVGPGDHAPGVIKASFLGSLLLQLHHPPLSSDRSGSFPNPLGFAAPQSLVLAGSRTSAPIPIPKLLLDWLNRNYPQTAELRSLKDVDPNPTASSNFWEILKAAVLRGHIPEAADILRVADFNDARSALEDGLPQTGYRGAQLQNIQKCVNRALQILDSCPGTQHGDWDVRGTEWGMYRRRVLAAVTDLEEFAEGGEQQDSEAPVVGNRFQAINFGLKPSGAAGEFSFAQSARMAESRVPWTIYQNLRSLYRIILGDTSAIMNVAQDWVEATISLTVWWDGEDDDESSAPSNGLGASTSIHFLRPRVSKPQPSNSNPEDAYLRRLDLAFNSATNAESDDGGFRVNSLSSIEVGLASVFEGNVDGVLELLQTWSLCVASAVAEVASAGGWLETTTGAKPLTGLSENDLMVLSYGQDGKSQKGSVSKDDILSSYASGLFERGSMDNGVRQGWELALEVLSRLNDHEKMQKSVSELLDKLPLDTAEQMDRAVLLCSELGLEKEGKRVSERFGDLTVSKTEEYGLALICYARAHNRRKVKSVVDLLISYSLVQSRAYPAPANLDEQLHSLIREPKACLSAVAGVDEEAAGILQFYFSGYATLRRYYETRDEAIGLKEGQRPRFKPLARRRAAAQALVAVISSAADSIYGGLYDPDRDSAVQVDGLLALLGEALPFVEQSTPTLSVSQQSAILSAIEDLETVTPRVYAQCEECFRSTLIEYHSSKRAGADSASNDAFVLPPSPRALLKKSVSSLTTSSTFSFIGSDMIESARNRSGSGSAGSSGVLVPRSGDDARSAYHERGWDWRAGLPEDAKGEDILRMLRLGLAKGLSFGALGSV
ncbi:nuclear pore complex subunit Nup85 [Aspergillus flavus]|uniref:Nuclear pore complex protein Nup85 n=2 Tax=Aspergillus flavus TaxID=5059 RepID=A0A7U2N225_ASPFN|nr:uncharacterized protein G4B84_009627 [Aspergillus flavus NRRL3357]KAJ1706502.1 nuclear pore complex subunit Nup85 [Aspergillus flavus]KAF7622520.1 hypothetical protein AFLA_009056 [Aspergillus flavus NRRL3357]QMW34161.1 hypothetical protein G4B84_009627 [Aspergillus flavus NRRL3357]QRD94084.1 nuclear pore complex subunit Nup85 [Aspergillus flavus]RMZ41526.1 nuclear pore complex subunit Nup85 [Aspergillus flavus]